MEVIKIIQKLCSSYVLLIIIIEVEKSDKTIKICLYNNITNLNNITIKDTRYIIYDKSF